MSTCSAVITGQHRPGSAAERNCPVHGARSARTVAAPVLPPTSTSSPTVIRRLDGSVAREEWRSKNGALHRLDGPAVIEPDANGVVTREEWHVDGKRHRLDGPAYIERDVNGAVTFEQWWMDGRRHRVDGPAAIERPSNGVVTREEWWADGKTHRSDGPAVIVRDPNGAVIREEWWVEGDFHRLDGPAIIRFYKDGSAGSQNWYLRGDEVPEFEVLAEFLGERASGLSESGLRELSSSALWHQWGEITDDQIAVMRLLYPNFGDGSMATVQS